jgi:hypothetical protein
MPFSAAHRALLDGVLDDDDRHRLKMGRFSEADENVMRRLINGRSDKAFLKLLGAGVDVTRQAFHSSRPQMPPREQGGLPGQTFTFSHRTVQARHEPAPPRNRVYVQGTASALGKAGARQDLKAIGPDGRQGVWYLPKASGAGSSGAHALPGGLQYSVGVRMAPVGIATGGARRFQAYIERDKAAVFNLGNIAKDKDARLAFWDKAEEIEGLGGRIQSRIIAELPFDKAVGDAGRERIVRDFAAYFEVASIPFHAVIHAPEDQSDMRNWHMHLIYYDRPRGEDGRLAARKWAEARKMSFVAGLRERWSDVCNAAFEAASLRRRFDPRSYREAGVDKEPGLHLGSKAAGLERRGIATHAGTRTAAREIDWRIGKSVERLQLQVLAGLPVYADVERLLRTVPDAALVQRIGAEVAELGVEAIASDHALRRAIGRRELSYGRAGDLVRRMRRVARRGPSPVQSLAAEIVPGLEKAGHAMIRDAAREERVQRQRHADVVSRLNGALGRYRAELLVRALVVERQRLLAIEGQIEALEKRRPYQSSDIATQQRVVDASTLTEATARRAAERALKRVFGRGQVFDAWNGQIQGDATRSAGIGQLQELATKETGNRATRLVDAVAAASALQDLRQRQQTEEGRLRRMKRLQNAGTAPRSGPRSGIGGSSSSDINQARSSVPATDDLEEKARLDALLGQTRLTVATALDAVLADSLAASLARHRGFISKAGAKDGRNRGNQI